jgi:hypothetical protein
VKIKKSFFRKAKLREERPKFYQIKFKVAPRQESIAFTENLLSLDNSRYYITLSVPCQDFSEIFFAFF